MPPKDKTAEIEVAETEQLDVKQTIIEVATMAAVTAAAMVGTHFVIKAIENRKS